MGVLWLYEIDNVEMEEFCCMLLFCVVGYWSKDGDDLSDNYFVIVGVGNGDVLEKLVCVISGVLYFGIVIVNKFFGYGYFVWIIVDNEGLVLIFKDFIYFFYLLIFLYLFVFIGFFGL